MRPLWIGLVGLSALAATARAQPRVTATMTLDTTIQHNGGRKPIVYLRNLLLDDRWGDELDNSLPLVITYRLQIWRSRDGWIDELTSEFTWQTVITKEPLHEEYAITLIQGNRPGRPRRFAVRDSAARFLDLPQLVQVFPQRPGRFYYHLSLRISALSDRDIDQLERFLAGDPDLDVPDPGSTLGRGIRRLLLRIAGLPSQELNARSELFDVRPE